jgi:hypothetical protein
MARTPVWSRYLTVPIARRIPTRHWPATLRAIKLAHTAIFFSVLAMIFLIAWDGARGRPRRRTAVAAGIALAEAAVFASNNQVCPLSPLAEDLGAESGSVTDIYLPGWLSRRIPVLSGTLLVVGLGLNVAARRRARSPR